MVASAAGAILGGAASAAVGSLLGGGGGSGAAALARGPLAKNLAAPGFDVRTSKDVLTLTRDRRTQALLDRLGLLSQQRADQVGGLLPKVAPGVSALRRARLEDLGNIRRRTVGDIRENLARRRVLGSSFAQDAVARAELGFTQEADRIRAESFMQELNLTMSLIEQQTRELQSAAARELDQANFELQAAANFANGVNVVASNNAAALAQLEAQSALNAGQFFAPFVNQVGQSVSNFVGGLFNPAPIQTDAAGRILGGI